MESDIRALLRRKETEKQILHPFASYGANNKLKCTVCDLNIPSAIQWDAHVGTSTHKKSVTKYKEAQQSKAKRALEKDYLDDGSLSDGTASKRRKQATAINDNLPADFFDPPEQNESSQQRVTNIDAEWEAFQKDIAIPFKKHKSFADDSGVVISALPTSNAADTQQPLNASNQDDNNEEEIDEITEQIHQELDDQKERDNRVEKLKEMRESLRKKQINQQTAQHVKLQEQDEDMDEDEEDMDENYNDFGVWRKY
ncbi:hypothetical protein V1514DRAFT_324929 [Lipomyces japonicus]|uniref:uncharacterized protein n=1 Tax=Lipomyces japonicus TaxID=56871 RepID=UPI0034CE5C58